ncbi:GntR family transcriptional regulator [Kineococcus esterisolvens]|uniref:GntR family transcriptional regulator n=1 Tax=unclassified Kineococcus TaxID=2621656 RepID=UPI003D7F0EC6
MTPGAKSSLHALGSIELQTRRELIHARLREAISSGELTPGTHLAEVELSEALGVSRGTLREALRQLQQEGLLTSDARGRLSVRVVTEREVEEIFTVRHALESLALELICAREDRTSVVARVREELENLREAEGDVTAQLDADLAFHERICELSGNTTLLHSWRSISGLARAAITAAGPQTALHNMAYQRHAPIADHLEAGDAAGGREFLRTHMREAAARIEQRMRRSVEPTAG